MKRTLNVLAFTVLLTLFNTVSSMAHLQNVLVKDIQFPVNFSDKYFKFITTDSKGLIWFSTNHNLYRYDGVRITPILNEIGQPIYNITALESSEDAIWIGTIHGLLKLNLVDWKLERVHLSQLNDEIFIKDKKVVAIGKSNDGGVYVALDRSKVYYLKGSNVREVVDISKYCDVNNRFSEVKSITEVENKVIITSSFIAGIVAVDKKEDQFKFLKVFTPTGYLLDKTIEDAVFDKKGNSLFSVGGDEIFYWDYAANYVVKHTFENGALHATFVKASDDDVLCIASNDFLYSFNFTTKKFKQENPAWYLPFKNKSVLTAKANSPSNILMYESGTERGMLKITFPEKYWNVAALNQTKNNSIRSIFKVPKDSNTVHVGSYGEGFMSFKNDFSTSKVNHSTLYVYSAAIWNDDSLYLNSEGMGGFWFDIDSTIRLEEHYLKTNHRLTTTSIKINDTLILVGCYEGLYIMNVRTNEIYDVNYTNESFGRQFPVTQLYQDGNILWVTSESGIQAYEINQPDDYFSLNNLRYNSKDEIPYSAIAVDSKHVYMATRGKGVIVLDKKNFRICDTLSIEEQLLSNTIFSILKYKDNLIIGTDKGLSVFNIKENKVYNFTVKDGLPHNEFNTSAAYLENSTVYMGTIKGMLVFDAEKISEIPNETEKMMLVSVSAKPSNGTEELVLFSPYTHQNEIIIDSRILSFTLQFAHILYEDKFISGNYFYRLDPSQEWLAVPEEMSLQFVSMNPGKYPLEIATLYEDGTLNKILFSTLLKVKPKFTQTPWFFILLLVICGGIANGIYKYIHYQRRLREKIRVNIAEDLHDEVGSLLSGLVMQADYLQYADEDKKKEYIDNIVATGRAAVSGMKDIVWNINEVNEEHHNIIQRMMNYTDYLKQISNVEFRFVVNSMEILINEQDRKDLWLIFKEALTNILKHSEASEVIISLNMTVKNLFKLEIEDNGKGTWDLNNASGNGLKNMRHRAERMGAEMNIIQTVGSTLIVIEKKNRKRQ